MSDQQDKERYMANSKPPTDKPEPPSGWIVRVLQTVAELPDRTSPDDWPEAMLVTHAELQRILEEEDAALRDRAVKAEAALGLLRSAVNDGLTCDDKPGNTCSSYGHDEDCPGVYMEISLLKAQGDNASLRADLAAARAERDALGKKYSQLSDAHHELLYGVERKFPEETRHETALRYIQEAERRAAEPCEAQQADAPKESSR